MPKLKRYKSNLDRAVRGNNLLDVVRRYGVEPVGGVLPGGIVTARECPFCGGEKSFQVNHALEIFHCFQCHTGGDAVTFVQLKEGVNVSNAINILLQTASPEPLR